MTRPLCCGKPITVRPCLASWGEFEAFCPHCYDYGSIHAHGRTEDEAREAYAEAYCDRHGEECPQEPDLSGLCVVDPEALDEHQAPPVEIYDEDSHDEPTLESEQDFWAPVDPEPARVEVRKHGRVALDRAIGHASYESRGDALEGEPW